jgi:hypothetical protein
MPVDFIKLSFSFIRRLDFEGFLPYILFKEISLKQSNKYPLASEKSLVCQTGASGAMIFRQSHYWPSHFCSKAIFVFASC